MNNTSRNIMLTKAYVIAGIMFLVIICIYFRIAQLQTIDYQEYRKLAQETSYRQVKIPAARGNIYAADGVLLATTILKYNVFLDLVTIKDKVFKENIQALADSLGKMFNKNSSYYKNKLIEERNQKNRFYKLVSNLDFEQYNRIKKFPIFNKGKIKGGIIIEKDTIRIKTITGFGDRILGFDDQRGRAGLEGAFSNYLRGKDGSRFEQRITKTIWKPADYYNEILPEEGKDIYTTIDMRIQDIAYSALQKQISHYNADHGCAIIMEVATGKIKAMANLTHMKDGSYTDSRNYAVYENSEPGSTFKVASLLAALDDGYINPNTMINIGDGSWKINDRTVIDEHSRGTLTATQILSQSSNIGTGKIINLYYGKNPENFVEKLDSWGLNKKLNIEIPGEGQPKIPHPKTDTWSKTSLISMSYGYEVHITPLQLLTFYNAIANNGILVKPLFLDKIEEKGVVTESFTTQVLNKKIASDKALSEMKFMLTQAVDKGTARSIYTPNLKMAGKTGTAKVEYWKAGPAKYQSSFCGFFPADNPKYSCIVVINKPDTSIGFYGSQVSAPVFKEIAGKVFLRTPLNITHEIQEKKKLDIYTAINQKTRNPAKTKLAYIPNLIGGEGNKVIPTLENAGIKVKYKGVGKILDQSLVEGTKVKKGMVIYLVLG